MFAYRHVRGGEGVCEVCSGSQRDKYSHDSLVLRSLQRELLTMLHVDIWINVPGFDARFGWENSLHGAGGVGRHHECKLDARGDKIGC